MTRSGRRLLGYGYTNAGGVATMDYDANNRPIPEHGYVGVGAGKINMRVECRSVSGTLNVWDTLWFDNGITSSHNDNWNTDSTNTGRLLREVGDEYCTLSRNGDNNGTLKANYSFTAPIIIEVDIKPVYSSNSSVICSIRKNGTSLCSIAPFRVGVNINEWNHLKMYVSSSKVTFDGSSYEYSLSEEPNEFHWWIQGANNSIQYKNFKIYQG